MLDYGSNGNKYRNTDAYPNKHEYMDYFIYKQGQCILTIGYQHSDDEENALKFQQICKNYGITDAITYKCIESLIKQGVVIEKILHADFQKIVDEYNHKTLMLERQWYNDLYEHYEVDRHNPLIQEAMSRAWEDGHGSGMQDVEVYFGRYLDFIKKVLKFTNPTYKLS